MLAKGNGRYPLVRIEWKDAHTISEWKTLEECPSALVAAVSVGFQVKESKEALTLAATESDGMWNDIQVIPKVLVTKRTVLKT